MTPISVGTGDGTEVCWDGGHEQQLSSGYNSACTPITGGITNIVVTASGSGYTSTPNVTISGGSRVRRHRKRRGGTTPSGARQRHPDQRRGGLYDRAGRDYYPRRRERQRGRRERGRWTTTLPVTSVGPTGASWASPSACYPVGSAPTVSFSPAGATATATMTGNTSPLGFAASGTCGTKNVTATVTATNGAGSGFTGTVTSGSNKKANNWLPHQPGELHHQFRPLFSVLCPVQG